MSIDQDECARYCDWTPLEPDRSKIQATIIQWLSESYHHGERRLNANDVANLVESLTIALQKEGNSNASPRNHVNPRPT